MEPLKALNFRRLPAHRSLGEPIDPDCESRSDRTLTRTASSSILYGIYACADHRWSRERRDTDPTHLIPEQTKTRLLRDRALPAWWRPTDLCATALFSFQGADAAAQPCSDRIFDRTGEARRQSQLR